MKRAQYRILGRLLRGERLPVSRYGNASFDALYRRALIQDTGTGIFPSGMWVVTDRGRKRHAEQKPRPVVTREPDWVRS